MTAMPAGAGPLMAAVDDSGCVVLVDEATGRTHTVTDVDSHVGAITHLRAVARGEEPYDPDNLPPFTVAWNATAHPGVDAPSEVYAAALTARTVEHVTVAGAHAQQQLVPHASARIRVLLEDSGLTPASVEKVAGRIDRELIVLVGECNADARKILHRRMAVDLAATLIPRLDGGATS